MSWVGGAESFGARVGPIAHHSHRDEIATDCRMDPMSDHWPLLKADPIDGERLATSAIYETLGARLSTPHPSRPGALLGYARVSTGHQSLDQQLAAAVARGIISYLSQKAIID